MVHVYDEYMNIHVLRVITYGRGCGMVHVYDEYMNIHVLSYNIR